MFILKYKHRMPVGKKGLSTVNKLKEFRSITSVAEFLLKNKTYEFDSLFQLATKETINEFEYLIQSKENIDKQKRIKELEKELAELKK